jgi:5-dehydro-2-deoxygluconokinase
MTEAFVVGRVGVDLTPDAPRTTLADAGSFVRAVGGFAGNIGTGLARLGISTAVVSAVGDDGHGDYVRRDLALSGIDVDGLGSRTGSRTQVAFFEAWPPDHFPVTFYRPDPAPDTQLTLADAPVEPLALARLVIVSATMLSAEPARTAILAVLAARSEARSRRGESWTILDLDWRPTLWARPDDYPGLVRQAAASSDIVIGSDTEFAAAALRPDATGAAAAMTVLKHGAEGVSLITAGTNRTLPGIVIEVTCALGAGDALTAAFSAGLLRGLEPLAALERGNAAGAIVASRLMCSSAMPSPAEIDELLARSPGLPLTSHPLEALP